MSQPRPPWHAAPVERGHPLVREMFDLLRETGLTLAALSDKAGLSRGTVVRWTEYHSPTVTSLDAALNAMGYELAIRKRG